VGGEAGNLGPEVVAPSQGRLEIFDGPDAELLGKPVGGFRTDTGNLHQGQDAGQFGLQPLQVAELSSAQDLPDLLFDLFADARNIRQPVLGVKEMDVFLEPLQVAGDPPVGLNFKRALAFGFEQVGNLLKNPGNTQVRQNRHRLPTPL